MRTGNTTSSRISCRELKRCSIILAVQSRHVEFHYKSRTLFTALGRHPTRIRRLHRSHETRKRLLQKHATIRIRSPPFRIRKPQTRTIWREKTVDARISGTIHSSSTTPTRTLNSVQKINSILLQNRASSTPSKPNSTNTAPPPNSSSPPNSPN